MMTGEVTLDFNNEEKEEIDEEAPGARDAMIPRADLRLDFI